VAIPGLADSAPDAAELSRARCREGFLVIRHQLMVQLGLLCCLLAVATFVLDRRCGSLYQPGGRADPDANKAGAVDSMNLLISIVLLLVLLRVEEDFIVEHQRILCAPDKGLRTHSARLCAWARICRQRCGRWRRPLSARDRQRARHHSLSAPWRQPTFISIVMSAPICAARSRAA